MSRRWLPLALALALLLGGRAWAHPLAPALLDLTEDPGGLVHVSWKIARLTVPGAPLRPLLPTECTNPTPPTDTTTDTGVVSRWTVDCGGRLVGATIAVDGLGAARTEALLRVALVDGRVVQAVLRPTAPSLVIPARPAALDVFTDYARLGVEHILTGADHLLFVFGLLLLVPALSGLVRTITAFTLGHSVTLSLVVLGVATVPSRLAELAIALTVLTLATELARDGGRPTLMRRYSWVMAAAFGLLHGLGFAGALREVGLPDGEIPLALLAFNCGIEVGQLGFVLAVVGLAAGARALLARWESSLQPGLRRGLRLAPVYTMGSLAAFWCFQRAAALLR